MVKFQVISKYVFNIFSIFKNLSTMSMCYISYLGKRIGLTCSLMAIFLEKNFPLLQT